MTQGKPEETCGDFGGHRNDGRECGRPSGWGTDFSDGKCRECRGTKPDGSTGEGHGQGDQEGNTNSVSHGVYADENNFYNKVISQELRALCDEIFQDYCTKYRELYGDVSTGHQARLFEIAVNQIKTIRADNWLTEKPESLDSGHELVDKETKYTSEGNRYHEYSESVLINTQQKLRREDRAWLKDMGLLEDPDSQKAGAIGDLAGVILENESN